MVHVRGVEVVVPGLEVAVDHPLEQIEVYARLVVGVLQRKAHHTESECRHRPTVIMFGYKSGPRWASMRGCNVIVHNGHDVAVYRI